MRVAASYRSIPNTLEISGEIKFSARYFQECLESANVTPDSADVPNLYYIAENTLAPDSAMRILRKRLGAHLQTELKPT